MSGRKSAVADSGLNDSREIQGLHIPLPRPGAVPESRSWEEAVQGHFNEDYKENSSEMHVRWI